MVKRVLSGLLAVVLTFNLCGCNSVFGGRSSKAKTVATSSNAAIVYDKEKGEYVQRETYNIEEMTGEDAPSTLDEEYEKEMPSDVKGAMTENQAEDHAELWKVEGTSAFFIPDYHSTKAEDLKDFVILDLVDDGNTVIYCYETVFYGKDTQNLLSGLSYTGTAPEHEHINWTIPEGKEEDSSYKPKSNWEVYCLIRYNTITRKYAILDVRLGKDSSASYDDSTYSAVRKLYESYLPGNQRLFSGKVRDASRRYGTEYLYYSMYDMKYTLLDGNGKPVKQLDASYMIFVSILDYFNRKFHWTDSDDQETIQNQIDTSKLTYSVASVSMNGSSTLLIGLNVSLDSTKEDEVPYSLLCSFRMYSADSTGGGIQFSSTNAVANQQVVIWEATAYSYEETLERCPNYFTWFKLDSGYGKTDSYDYRLCAVKVRKNDVLENDTNLGYFSRLFQRYFDMYKTDNTEQQDDYNWRKAYQEASGGNWNTTIERTVPAGENGSKQEGTPVKWEEKSAITNKSVNYSTIMNNVARPAAVSGDNYQYLLNQHDTNGNILFAIYDKSESKTSSDVGMGSVIYRTNAAKLESYNIKYVTAERTLTDEAGNKTYETQDFIDTVEIKLMDNEASAERFDTVEMEDGKNLVQTPDGDTVYYQVKSGEDDDPTTTIWMPDYTNSNHGIIRLSDLSSGMKVLSEKKGNGTEWVVAVTGDQAIWVYQCKQTGSGSGTSYSVNGPVKIPYTMAITPQAEIGTTTKVEYTDESGNAVSTDVGQKATLTGRNAIEYEEDDGNYRFTTLQSGIIVYDPQKNKSMVIDKNQYYASWKMEDGSYTAIGFQTQDQNAGFEDIMKAKIYHDLNISEEEKLLLTLQERLKVDLEMQARFLKQPNGWKDVCEEYQFNPDTSKEKKIEAYAKETYAIYNAYDTALETFWKLVKLHPTSEQETMLEEQFLNCESRTAMDRLVKDTLSEYVKTQETKAASTETSRAKGEVDDGWIKKVKQSQKEALEKQEREKYIRQNTDDSADIDYRNTLDQMVEAAKNKRTVWER